MSAAKDALVAEYLKAFGAIDLKNTLPPVFNPKYEAQWEVFTESFKLRSGLTAESRRLYTILEFMRYMKAARLKPLRTPVKHPSSTRITESPFMPNTAYEQLAETDLRSVWADIDALLRKNRLNTELKTVKTKSDITASKGKPPVLDTLYVLAPPKGSTLDAAIQRLEGTLFDRRQIPSQLKIQVKKLSAATKARPKVLNRSVNELIKSGTVGWYPIRQTPDFSALLMRAKDDRLVLKIRVNLNLDIEFGDKARLVLNKLWKYVSNPT